MARRAKARRSKADRGRHIADADRGGANRTYPCARDRTRPGTQRSHRDRGGQRHRDRSGVGTLSEIALAGRLGRAVFRARHLEGQGPGCRPNASRSGETCLEVNEPLPALRPHPTGRLLGHLPKRVGSELFRSLTAVPHLLRKDLSELRWNPLLEEWVTVAPWRQDRRITRPEHCPLCPTRPPGRDRGPEPDYHIVVFENRFPAYTGSRARRGRLLHAGPRFLARSKASITFAT